MWERLYTYDIETYPNMFSCGIVHMDSGTRWLYEISDRVNQGEEFVHMMGRLRDAQCRMIGFNNEHFDYPVIHHMWNAFYSTGGVTVADAYNKAQEIIDTNWNDRFRHNVWPRDVIVPQVDLFKIMHFDNHARSTSLKKLEMNSRSGSVQDLPFPPGTLLTDEQKDVTIRYMCHDIAETCKFAREVSGSISFRNTLTELYGMDATNFNDTKIGKEYFIAALEKTGVSCFDRSSGRKKPRQTPRREGIRVADRLLPIRFSSSEFQRMYEYFKTVTIPADETKGFFTDLTADLNGFEVVFGAGGIHGSVHNRTFRSDDTHVIIDVDVVSYYPSIAISNRWYPEHLGDVFCDIYADLKQQRVSQPKGTPENAMLKLALNGVYGDSNNKYSPFYDPSYTMAVTINGQMLLCLLAEYIVGIPDSELIQMNTDGLTVRLPRDKRHQLDAACVRWEAETRLTLESVDYDAMFVRDVNNYVAVGVDGKVKRKNAYMIEPQWHQDRSSLVVPKAVSAYLLDGIDPTSFIFDHSDPFDFMRHVKVPRSSRLEHGETVVQNTSRYFIALDGEALVKIMPPLSGKIDERCIGVDVGWQTIMCNDATDFDWSELNRRWYINEAEKLIKGVGL
jgi:hypothetical protein